MHLFSFHIVGLNIDVTTALLCTLTDFFFQIRKKMIISDNLLLRIEYIVRKSIYHRYTNGIYSTFVEKINNFDVQIQITKKKCFKFLFSKPAVLDMYLLQNIH